MTARVIAWAVLAGVLFAGYQGYKAFKNPWATPATAITAVMPPMTSCDKDCTK